MISGVHEFLTLHIQKSENLFFAVFDNNDSLIDGNTGFMELLKTYKCEEDPRNLFFAPSLEELKRSAREGKGKLNTVVVTVGNEEKGACSFRASIEQIDENLVIFGEMDAKELTSINNELTELNREIETLNRQLVRKDTALHEINHRVKNNLLILRALIRKKEAKFNMETDFTEVLSDINAIRILHEKLYQIDDVAQLNIAEYVDEIIEELLKIHGDRLSVEKNLEVLTLETSKVLPLGLIINELIINTLKHGLPKDETPGRFSIDLQKDRKSNNCVLQLSNNGEPLPEDIDITSGETMGFRLISQLTEQLDASLEVIREPHPVFTITLPC